MNADTKNRGRAAGPRAWLPHAVLAAVLIAATTAAYYVGASGDAEDRLRFENAVQRTSDDIRGRLGTYVAMLRAGAGLFAAGDVDAERFRRFVERLELRESYPGIQAVGFSARVGGAAEVERLTEEMRARGVNDFRVMPEGERPEYHSIIYIEPEDERNRAALGFDMFSEPVRREAMERARDTGEPAASGRVRLVQEIGPGPPQAGFLIYAPVYRGGATPRTVEERREALAGFVYAPFRADDLLRGIFGGEPRPLVNFRVYDGGAGSPEGLLHESVGEDRSTFDSPRFVVTREIVVEGRRWSLVFVPRPGSGVASRGWAAPLVALAGLAFGLALFFAVRSQVRARSAAERAFAESRTSERRFRTLVEQSPVSTQIFSPDGLTVRVNRAWEELWGVTLEQLGEYNILKDPQLEEKGIAEYIRRGFAGEAVDVPAIVYNPEETVPGLTRHKDPRRWVSAVIYPVKDDEGRVCEVVLMHQDITEKVRASEELEARARELAEANRMKDEFLATLSHELRTPLTSVLGWAKLLRTGRFDADAAARAYEAIERNAEAQTRLINDLLDVSRVITGKLRLDPRPVDLGPVVAAAVESARPAADARGVRLEVLAGGGALVYGDPDRLQQVVWNLLSNAIKFTPRGGRVRVRLDASDDDGHALLEVSDTGRGIPAEFLPHVFERFRQADGRITREHGGLGLGLAIARHLVELHGGTISAASEGEGRGATFAVELPLTRLRNADFGLRNKEEDEAAADEESAIRNPHSAILDGLHVLVVDDDEDSRLLLSAVLGRAGARTTVAASAAEALEAVGRMRPDVIVADIGMPGEDGYELIRKVRAAGSRVPAAALTAYARPEDRARALEAGYREHLAKPSEPSAIVAAVARLAGREK